MEVLMDEASKDGQPSQEPELLEDGQEEVFSRTAVERGLIEDPKAMGPDRRPPPDTAGSHKPA
jgi:hypothetical protein